MEDLGKKGERGEDRKDCRKCKVAPLCLARGTPDFQFDFYQCQDCKSYLLGRTLSFYNNPDYEKEEVRTTRVTPSNTVEFRKILDAESGRHVRLGWFGLHKVELPSCIDPERFDPANTNKWLVRHLVCPVCLAKKPDRFTWMKGELSHIQETIARSLGVPEDWLKEKGE